MKNPSSETLLIRCETVSSPDSAGEEKFHSFRLMLPALFPALFGSGEYREFSNGFTLRWPGRNPEAKPVLFLNHHDVVEAAGEWRHPPFSGEIAEGSLWGRGTLDDKGGLWAMLQAADELAVRTKRPAGFWSRVSVLRCALTRAVSFSAIRFRASAANLP